MNLDEAAWRHALNVNLTGAFLMSKYTVPLMLRTGSGSIIHVASQLGHVGNKGRAAYGATKAALIHLTRVMALDYAAHGIRVNSLSPEAIMTSRLVTRYGSQQVVLARLQPLYPVERIGTPQEVASAAVFLARRILFCHRHRSTRGRRLHRAIICSQENAMPTTSPLLNLPCAYAVLSKLTLEAMVPTTYRDLYLTSSHMPDSVLGDFGDLNAAANETLSDPKIREKLESMTMIIMGGAPQKLKEVVVADVKKWAGVINSGKLK